jgi:hypothetical protein
MKDKINKIFHTDKWWGKTILIFSIYFIFWLIFYGVLFIIPNDFFSNYIPGLVTLFYVIIIIPAISFYLIKLFKKIFFVNKYFYLIHIFYIILSLLLFFIVFLISAYSNYSIPIL